MRKPSARRKSQSTPNETTADVFSPGWMKICAGLLIGARFLVPTEDADEGGTLLIATGWLLLVVLWLLGWWRFGRPKIVFGWIDACVWTMAAGHVISFAAMCFSGGDLRAGLNLTWEWVAIATAFFLLRNLATGPGDRAGLATGLLVMAVVLSGYAVWQRYVWYPQTSGHFAKLLGELETLEKKLSAETINRDETRRLAELQQDLTRNGVPLDPEIRELFKQRLLHSREPFAFFALANTFAGFLAVALVLLLPTMFSRGPVTPRRLVFIGGALLIAFALVLTKSRTAWVGTVVGLGVWFFLRVRSGKTEWTPKHLGIVTTVGLAGLIVFLAIPGTLDREVISESPRSLKFRLQYWSATLSALGESPVFGTGPGNFRQHYVAHRLPEASERIADPHNWVLDLWCQGGILALLAMLALLGFVVFKQPPKSTDETQEGGTDLGWGIGIGVAFLAAAGFSWFVHRPALPLLLCGVAFVAAFFEASRSKVFSLPRTAGLAAGAVWLTHCLGAGGAEMPAMVQLFLLMALFAIPRTVADAPPTPQSKPTSLALSVVFPIALIGLFVTGLKPQLDREAFLRRGEQHRQKGDVRRAIADWERAADADSLSAAPWQRLGTLHSSLFEVRGREDDFSAAKAAWREFIARDPLTSLGYRETGRLFAHRAEKTKEKADARTAETWFAKARLRDPVEVKLMVMSFENARNIGDERLIRDLANRAVLQDGINRAEGHKEKFLAEDTLAELRKAAE